MFKFIKRHRRPFDILVKVLEWILKIGIWGFALIALAYSVNNISLHLGEVSAQSKTSFTAISTEGKSTQKIIIYKNSTEITLKAYDLSKGEFLDGYEVVNGASYTTRSVNF